MKTKMLGVRARAWRRWRKRMAQPSALHGAACGSEGARAQRLAWRSAAESVSGIENMKAKRHETGKISNDSSANEENMA